MSDIGSIVVARRSQPIAAPLVGSSHCGFPSPAADYLERPLDFNELLVDNIAATFVVRINGPSMLDAGLFPGDLAIVNRASEAVDGVVVLALLDGEFTIKRYRRDGDRVWLQAEGPGVPDRQIGEDSGLEIWGVITHSIRMKL